MERTRSKQRLVWPKVVRQRKWLYPVVETPKNRLLSALKVQRNENTVARMDIGRKRFFGLFQFVADCIYVNFIQRLSCRCSFAIFCQIPMAASCVRTRFTLENNGLFSPETAG